MAQDLEWGLAANGSSGPLYMDVDETTDSTGTTLWQVQFHFPSTDLCFGISDPSVLVETLKLFERTYQADTAGEIELGHCFERPFIIAKDEEFNDRYFFRIQGRDSRFDCWLLTLGGEEVAHFMAALRQVVADLEH